MNIIRRHHISFKIAFSGLKWALTTQPNFRVHAAFSVFAFWIGFWLKVSYVEMTILVLAIVFGLGVEMVNTAIESITDLITTEYRQQAKIAKDVAAGMMLVVAIGTVVVACLIFIPRLAVLFFP